MDNFKEEHENIIDADFIEISEEEKLKNMNINKEPLYYTRGQVAKILNEAESTISYWSKQFQPLLNIKIINMTRKYTKGSIENLMFIQKLLREDHLTIQQVSEYCTEKGFNNKTGLLDDSNPLAIQTFISAMTVEFDKKVTEMQNNIIKQQQEMIGSLQIIITDNNNLLRQEISLTVDESISEKFNEFSENTSKDLKTQIQDNFDNINIKNDERDNKLIEHFKCITIEELKSKQESKGLINNISKLLHLKK